MIRRFFLDGGGSTHPNRSRAGELGADEVSLVLIDGQVIEYPSGRVVGSDVFAVLEERLDGDPDTHWVGYFGYAARSDLPAASMPGVPDAIWMCCRQVEFVDPAVTTGFVVSDVARTVDPDYA
ncbi:MAG TPA: hypothetical protein PKM12_03800, partial [Marmoricola sp.]|nr:hypothetical protein [Marmoricola sp.]